MTEKSTNVRPELEGRVSGLEASFKSIREDNVELKHEMGRVWEGLAGLRNDFATVTHQLQNSISEAMVSFNEKRIEDSKDHKINWIPILGLAGMMIAGFATIGTIVTGQLYDTQSQIIATMGEMVPAIGENATDSAVNAAVIEAQNDRINMLENDIRELRREHERLIIRQLDQNQ